MLGLVLIYSIGKYFFELAIKNNKNKWLYAVLGVLVYYLGELIGGLLLGISSFLFGFEVDWDNKILMAVIGLPFGIAFCWLFYYLLDKKWTAEVIKIESIDDIGRN